MEGGKKDNSSLFQNKRHKVNLKRQKESHSEIRYPPDCRADWDDRISGNTHIFWLLYSSVCKSPSNSATLCLPLLHERGFFITYFILFFYLLWLVRRNINAGCDYSGQTAICCLIWFKWNPFVNRLPLCSINRISTETRQTWTELVHMVHPVHFRDLFRVF